MEVGDIGCMVRAMGSSTRVQCALALQSAVSENVDIDVEAKRAVVKYAREGVKHFVSVAWTAENIFVYTADVALTKVFKSGTFFSDPKELEVDEVAKIERDLWNEEEAQERNKPKNKMDELREEEPEEGLTHQECMRAFLFKPAEPRDRDYPPFITFVHDTIQEATTSDVVPKMLTSAKAVAGRARSIKEEPRMAPGPPIREPTQYAL